VDAVACRLSAEPRRELEARGCGTLEKDARDGIRAFDALERAGDRVRRVADAVAVEVEAAIAAPVVALAVQRPARPRVTAAEDDVTPVVEEAVAGERIPFGAGEQRCRRVVV